MVSHSTVKAEYRSLAATACELHWISFLLDDFGIKIVPPIPLHCDNKAALHIMANSIIHKQTKHIEIECHIVRNAYKDGFVHPSHIKGTEQLADHFTKPLAFKAFSIMVSKLGLVSFIPSLTCGGLLNIQELQSIVRKMMLVPLFLLIILKLAGVQILDS
ncbi:UNVERIFIED_CONTAM: hypothetical protein Sradi_2338800 [Sesamum radiatum]|uniref:Copia protein n=1 Tax=Sesamum radiatum TaxID=300843 RepID=A0AAW2T546_SESRA